MTEILCRWLNEDVGLSRYIDQLNFAKEFATGYLIGELLDKHTLQIDFADFSQNTTSDSKLNNFTRLEPTLKLLEIPYDTNIARSIMNENHSAVTRLMYQLFITLGKKNKMGLTGVAMETMRPSGPVKLENIERGMYKEKVPLQAATPSTKDVLDCSVENLSRELILHEAIKDIVTGLVKDLQEISVILVSDTKSIIGDLKDLSSDRHFADKARRRLKQLTKRQVDLNFESLVQRYQAKQKQQEELAFKSKFGEEEKMKKYQQAQRQKGLDKSRNIRNKQQEMMDKIRDATVKIPKPPESKKSAKTRSALRRQREAEEVKESIDTFEASLKATIPPVSPAALDEIPKSGRDIDIDVFVPSETAKQFPEPLSTIKPGANRDYINKIRTQLDEDAVARQEREKRRRRVLVEQLKAHETQEEAHREEMLVNRLMRQSQQERRIAVQLMQVRHEKEVIRQNRIFREQQYAERRLKDFDDALEREAEMCRQAKLEYAEETRMAQDLHDRLAAERAQAKYNKRYDICSEILSEIVDFSCKVGEYRELTEKLVPAKLFREWKDLFINGIPQYPVQEGELSPEELQKEQEIKNEKEKLLDEGDFMEYKNLIGEWVPIEGLDIQGPPKDNAVLGHIIQRLFNIVSPPEPPPPPPEFPPFPIKACFLGKFFSGKTTVINKLVEYHRLVRLSMDQLVKEAIEAHKNSEVIEEQEPEPQPTGDSSKKPGVVEPVADPTKLDQEQTSRAVSAGSVAASTDGTRDVQDTNRQQSQGEQQEEKRDKTKEELEKEKEVEAVKSSAADKKDTESTTLKSKGPKPTARAKLGVKAYGFLKKGKPTPDQLIVDIMVEAVRNVPEGTGWIMDGFPSTINQAKLLEKALTGYDEQKQLKEAKAAKEPGKVGKTKKSRLAPDPHPATESPSPKSGINLVVMFDLPDEVALKRAEGRTYNPITEEKHHQQYNPPPQGSYTGINKQEKVAPVVDPSNDKEQVQQRITGFLDAWPKLEKWFSRFGVLQKINADKTQDDLYEEAAAQLNEAYQKQIIPPEEHASEVASAPPSTTAEGEGPEDQTPSMEIFPGKTVLPIEGAAAVAPSESGIKSEKGTTKTKSAKSGSKPGSPKGGKKSSKKDRSPSPTGSKKSPKSRSPSPTSKKGTGSRAGSRSPSPSKKGSRPGSKASSRPGSKRGRSPKKGTEEPVEENTPEPEGPPKPLPGSEEWEYVDLPIEKDFAEVLSGQWENVEDSYVDTCKIVFRKIRHERELIYRYFYGSRKDFVNFLMRPDEKQEYVIQWQKEYNGISEDMRSDEDTKAELHQRVDDLCDRLYEICDNRKEMAEKERQGVMGEGWLEDRLGVLTNHYIGVMQTEVDRYQDTMRLLKDYYVGMEVPNGKVPGEAINDYSRLPLVELPPTIRPQSASSKASDSAGNMSSDKPEPKSPSGKKTGTKTPEPTEGGEDEQKPRIPLVPRRPKSGDAGPGKGKDKKAGVKKDKQSELDKSETPVPPSDPDEKLIFDAFILANTIIDTLAALDQAEQEADAQRQVELEREKEKEALQKKAKDKKDKKGRKSPVKSPSKTETPPLAPTEESEGPSEEEKLKQQIKEKSREEFLGSVAFEDKGLKIRLEMIRAHAIAVLQDLKAKAEAMYKDMEEWLGERFLHEVDSIKTMASNICFAVEQEQRLQEEVLLEDKDFIVDLDIKTFKTPTPPPPPVQIEIPTQDSFTVAQILSLCNQFVEAAPSGVISNRGFCDIILDLANLTFGTESLPDIWMHITQQQLQEVCSLLSPDNEFIDWRKFLLAAAQPWTPPSKIDLLLTLEQFRLVDQGGLGLVDVAQYAEVDMWFTTCPTDHDMADDIELILAYDRLARLKEAFFHIFAYRPPEAPLLDYNAMLMYFAADSDPLEGVLRALSIATSQAMPSSNALPYIPLVMNEGSDISVPNIQLPGTPPPEMDALVGLDDLIVVLNHSQNKDGDTHRLSFTSDPVDSFSRERLAGVFLELGADEDEALPFHLLYRHPIMQDCMQMCQLYNSVDLKTAFKGNGSDGFE